jgi:hypothetical protein
VLEIQVILTITAMQVLWQPAAVTADTGQAPPLQEALGAADQDIIIVQASAQQELASQDKDILAATDIMAADQQVIYLHNRVSVYTAVVAAVAPAKKDLKENLGVQKLKAATAWLIGLMETMLIMLAAALAEVTAQVETTDETVQ